jgi:Tol biopolymer transport system component
MRSASMVLAASTSALLCACSPALRRGLVAPEGVGRLEQVTLSGVDELDPAVSPDGATLAFETADSQGAPPRIETMALRDAGTAGAPRATLGSADVVGLQPSFMPDGTGLVFLSREDGAYRIVQTFGPTPGRTHFVAAAGNASFPALWPAVSPDGMHVALSMPGVDVFRTGWSSALSFDAALAVTDLFGTGMRVLGEGTDPAWSPHGKRLAFVRRADDGHHHVYVARADGSDARAITDGPDEDRLPAWSPDGGRIAFCSVQTADDGSKRANVFVVGADGSGLRQLTEGDRFACRPAWGRDGFVYFHADATGHFHIWRIGPV